MNKTNMIVMTSIVAAGIIAMGVLGVIKGEPELWITALGTLGAGFSALIGSLRGVKAIMAGAMIPTALGATLALTSCSGGPSVDPACAIDAARDCAKAINKCFDATDTTTDGDTP